MYDLESPSNMAPNVIVVNSRRRESRHGGPRVTTKALHFWGHCTLPTGSRRREAPEKDWTIELDSYKEIEVETQDARSPDLIYRTSMRAKEAFEAAEDASQHAASEHTKIRLDRFSQARDWESYLWPTKIEIDGVETQVVLHLYDAGRMTRLYPGRQGIPNSVVTKAVTRLLDRQKSTDDRNASAENPSSNELNLPCQPDGTAHAALGATPQSPEKKQPDETQNSQPGYRHRRWNRRFKRSAKDVMTHLQTANEDPQYDSMLPWAPRLLSHRIPKDLRNLPYLLVGSNPDDFGDSLVFPLSVPGTKHVLGCLAISREWFGSENPDEQVRGSSFLTHMFYGINHIDIFPSDEIETQVNVQRPKPSAEYWEKFMQDRLLGLGWDHENAFEYQVGRFYQHDSLENLATFLSLYTYGHPPLIYPDEQDGPMAQPEEFFEQYCCLPLHREKGTELSDCLAQWLNPEGLHAHSGLLGKPLTVYDPDHGHQLWSPAESHPDDLPSCLHDLLQTAQDYYVSLDKLCANKQLTQADYLEKVRYSTRYEDLRPSIRPLGDVLKIVLSETPETDLRDDTTKWLDDWTDAAEIYPVESDGKDEDNSWKDDTSNSGSEIEGDSDKAFVPSGYLWTRELWSLIQQGSRIPYWCQKQIFNCTNMLLIEGIDKWLWRNGPPKTDFSEPFHFEVYGRRRAMKSDYIDSQSNEFCQDSFCPLNAQRFTKADRQAFNRVRAYALFQSGLCILNGFGTERNVKKGVLTILKAAEQGCRFARAVIHPLAKAYNRMDLIKEDHSEWTIVESKCSSHWALENLRHNSPQDNYSKLRGSMLFEQMLLKSRGATFPEVGIGKKKSRLNYDSSDSDELPLEDSELQTSKPPNYLIDELSKSVDLPVPEPDDDPIAYHHLIRWTCCFGLSERLDHLLQKGSSRITKEKLGEYLVLSLHGGDPDATLLLLERGAKSTDHLEGLNPFFLLHNMPSERMPQLVQAFVDQGFDVNEKADVRNVQFTSLYPTMSDWPEGFYRGATWLRPLPLDVYIRGKSITPLRWAILQDNAALVQALVDHGAEFPSIPNRTVSRVEMPQKWPVDICTAPILDEPTYNIEILRIFLEKHGEQADQAPFAETPLGLIVMEPDTHLRRLRFARYTTREQLREVLSLLRQYQPHCDARLFWAAVMNNHEEIVKELIDEGLNIGLRFKGMTPLHVSILHGRVEIFHLLLEHGADVRALTTTRGMSALHLLFLLENDPETELAMLDKLHSLLGDVDMTHTPFGTNITPLHLAVLSSRVESVERLIQLGANTTRVLGDNPMPGLRGALNTEWGHREGRNILKVSPEHDLRLYPATPINLEGLTPIGIIIEREDMYLPQDATRMLTSLMTAPSLAATDMTRFYIRPDLKQTILHLLPLTNLAEKTDIVDRVKEIGEPAGLDINTPDIHGDTPLHYAYAFGGAAPPEMWDHYHDADQNRKNMFGLTPLESRLWKFTDSSTSPKEERGVSVQIVTWGPLDPRGVPSVEGSPLAKFWWGLERGLAISQCWETKSRQMKRNRDDVDGIKLETEAWTDQGTSYGRVPRTAFTMVQ